MSQDLHHIMNSIFQYISFFHNNFKELANIAFMVQLQSF
jgi:hypothetical protein